jgi:hypothetical protein
MSREKNCVIYLIKIIYTGEDTPTRSSKGYKEPYKEKNFPK